MLRTRCLQVDVGRSPLSWCQESSLEPRRCPPALPMDHFPACGRQARPGPRDAEIRGVLPPVRLSCPRGGLPPAVRSWPDYPVVARLPCAGNRGALGAQRATSARRPNLRSEALFFYPAGPDYPVMVWTPPARKGGGPPPVRRGRWLRFGSCLGVLDLRITPLGSRR